MHSHHVVGQARERFCGSVCNYCCFPSATSVFMSVEGMFPAIGHRIFWKLLTFRPAVHLCQTAVVFCHWSRGTLHSNGTRQLAKSTQNIKHRRSAFSWLQHFSTLLHFTTSLLPASQIKLGQSTFLYFRSTYQKKKPLCLEAHTAIKCFLVGDSVVRQKDQALAAALKRLFVLRTCTIQCSAIMQF